MTDPLAPPTTRRWPRHRTGRGDLCVWSGHPYIGPETTCPAACAASADAGDVANATLSWGR